MYIARNCCKTQGLRKAYINSTRGDRNYNLKTLRSLDKTLARKYTDTKYYGGSLKSFWKGVKKFGKRIINSAVNTTRNMYKPAKWIIKTVNKSDGLKNVINGVGNAIGSTVGVPGLGKMITTGLGAADKISDGIENVIKNIKDKNPGLAMDEIKHIVGNVKNTVDDVVSQTNISDEEKQKIKDKTQNVYDKLPDVIKDVGYSKAVKAAGYLPFLDPATLKTTERTGKGGAILKPKYRFIKPKIITEHKESFSRLPLYDPKIVGEVGGRMYMSGGAVYKTVSTKDVVKKEEKNRDSKDTEDIIARLKKRINKK